MLNPAKKGVVIDTPEEWRNNFSLVYPYKNIIRIGGSYLCEDLVGPICEKRQHQIDEGGRKT